MGSISGDLQAIFEDERRAVTTPDAVLESVAARIRRRRAGTLTGASAGTAAVVGLAAAVPFALSHLDGADLTPGATPSVTATYFMPENPLGLRCGDPIPNSLAGGDPSEVNVFSVTVEVETLDTPGVEPPIRLVISGSDLRPAVGADYSWALLARDGVVAGWTATTAYFDTSATGTTIEYSSWPCPAARNDATGHFLDGTYIEYMIGDANGAP